MILSKPINLNAWCHKGMGVGLKALQLGDIFAKERRKTAKSDEYLLNPSFKPSLLRFVIDYSKGEKRFWCLCPAGDGQES